MYDAATRRSAGGRRGSSRGTYIVHCTREAPQAEPDRAFARQATLGSTRALACPLRPLAAMFCRGKVRDGEGAFPSMRGACAPQKEATVPSRFNCGACYLALLTLTRHLLRGNQLKKGLEFAKSLLK